jgi:hypothetical protein
VPVRWLSIGAVAVVAFPPLARAGRSRVLAWSAVGGVPVLATGAGLAGVAPATVVVALAGVLLLIAVRPTTPTPSLRSLDGVVATAAPVLALVAVHAPLVVGVGAASWAAQRGTAFGDAATALPGPVAAQLTAAGWLADDWTTGALAGVLAVLTLAVAASRRRSARLAIATPLTALAALLVTLMPPATPRLALLLAPAVAFLMFELAAMAAGSALWSRPLRTFAWLAELTTVVLLPVVLLVVLGVAVPASGDPDAAFALAVGALGLLTASARRRRADADAPEVPVLLGGAGLTLAAAVALVLPRVVTVTALRPVGGYGWLPVALVLLVTAAATLRDRLRPDAPDRRTGMVAIAVGTLFTVLATTSMLRQPHLVTVTVAAVLVLAAHLRSAQRAGGQWSAELVAAALPVAIGIGLAGLYGPGSDGGLASVAVTSATLFALLVLAVVVAPLAPARATTLTAVALVGMLAGAGVAGWSFAAAAPTPGQAVALFLVGGSPASLVPVALAGLGIVGLGVRWRDARLGVLVAPLAVRALVVAGLAAGAGLPVAMQLWAAGSVTRRRHGTSSWLTDVPPLLLVAIPALAERLAGGPGWHAVLAGGLAAVAIAYGGAVRLGGPLVVGTVVLVATVAVESVAMIAAVPTWAWLAAGGAGLLATAAAIERTGGSPVTAARRLREVVAERFD